MKGTQRLKYTYVSATVFFNQIDLIVVRFAMSIWAFAKTKEHSRMIRLPTIYGPFIKFEENCKEFKNRIFKENRA